MTTPQLNLTKNAEIVLKTRYLLGDETPGDLLADDNGVAGGFAGDVVMRTRQEHRDRPGVLLRNPGFLVGFETQNPFLVSKIPGFLRGKPAGHSAHTGPS